MSVLPLLKKFLDFGECEKSVMTSRSNIACGHNIMQYEVIFEKI